MTKVVCWQRRQSQHGVSALEFALVFPVLFLMLYGMVSYALILAAQHSLSQAAAEGARAAVRFHTQDDAAIAQVRSEDACQVAEHGLGWLTHFGGLSAGACDVRSEICAPASMSAGVSNPALSCVLVQLTYDYESKPLLPQLPLLPVPKTLVGEAMAQIALRY